MARQKQMTNKRTDKTRDIQRDGDYHRKGHREKHNGRGRGTNSTTLSNEDDTTNIQNGTQTNRDRFRETQTNRQSE